MSGYGPVTQVTVILRNSAELPFMNNSTTLNSGYWNERYAASESVYGEKPVPFFKRFIDTHKPGTLLLPGEGEGRNAVYAASKGWQVDALDFSDVAREKAMARARKKNVSINYTLQDLAGFKPTKQYDAVGLMYLHLPPGLRRSFHEAVCQALKPGGLLVMEAFTPAQLQFDSGGPKDRRMLYDAATICRDFPMLHVIFCGEKEVVLDEGPYHQGKAAVLQLIGQKL